MTYHALYISGIVGMAIGFLVGMACTGNAKKLNAKINKLERLNAEWLETAEYQQGEIDRRSDLIAAFQAQKPERETNGQFVSKRKAMNVELAAYVASKS